MKITGLLLLLLSPYLPTGYGSSCFFGNNQEQCLARKQSNGKACVWCRMNGVQMCVDDQIALGAVRFQGMQCTGGTGGAAVPSPVGPNPVPAPVPAPVSNPGVRNPSLNNQVSRKTVVQGRSFNVRSCTGGTGKTSTCCVKPSDWTGINCFSNGISNTCPYGQVSCPAGMFEAHVADSGMRHG